MRLVLPFVADRLSFSSGCTSLLERSTSLGSGDQPCKSPVPRPAVLYRYLSLRPKTPRITDPKKNHVIHCRLSGPDLCPCLGGHYPNRRRPLIGDLVVGRGRRDRSAGAKPPSTKSFATPASDCRKTGRPAVMRLATVTPGPVLPTLIGLVFLSEAR
jgi:hypothetical protein